TQGTITVDDQTFDVTGLSWMDHEVSTSALSAGQVGWDWFSFQLSDGTELMLFNLRREDGQIDPYSSGSLIGLDGGVTPLKQADFTIRATSEWRSPRSGAVYPSGWKIEIPGQGISLTVEPYLADQEHALSYAYWEGAVRVRGERGGQGLTGAGYAELTGYAGSMAGDF
ncbi:MAG TPA: lipocalin family protein, partial [Anaerolineaceae bacterium]|nr:lipocalin family protein [Anaerolineaceae bacterium]